MSSKLKNRLKCIFCCKAEMLWNPNLPLFNITGKKFNIILLLARVFRTAADLLVILWRVFPIMQCVSFIRITNTSVYCSRDNLMRNIWDTDIGPFVIVLLYEIHQLFFAECFTKILIQYIYIYYFILKMHSKSVYLGHIVSDQQLIINE